MKYRLDRLLVRLFFASVCCFALSISIPGRAADSSNFPGLPAINFLLHSCDVFSGPVPSNQFNIGDSIGVGEAASDDLFEAHPETVWSTGYASADSVESLNERLEEMSNVAYYENNENRDAVFNKAFSGAVMADFQTQAEQVVSSAASTPNQDAGMVTVLLGSNDVCAESLEGMTDPIDFEAQYRSGLDVLAASPLTKSAQLRVSSIPAIYWLWEAKRNQLGCPLIWNFVPCENLLDNPENDCSPEGSHLNPDTVNPDDGLNCTRRKQFHARIRDEYNPILKSVLDEYKDDGSLPNASYIDIFDVRFSNRHVNSGDCFHPSESGHALLAEKHWCR